MPYLSGALGAGPLGGDHSGSLYFTFYLVDAIANEIDFETVQT
jgi:hypothetical protein